MPTLLSRNAHIADYAANPATGSENAGTFSPDLVELLEEMVVVDDLA